ncbi:MAG: hypothetical protein WBL07_18020 [Thiothrix litoralis]|uniref:hypothetical protein n=1 Tax=Thiothrix litoralis TaxID=2891210 RepID=UPI003C71AC96
MPEITEGTGDRQLVFHFPPEWQAIKYDALDGFYKTVVQRAPLDFKAVDILARSPLDTFIWIEIKDCAGYEAENSHRFSQQDSAELVASKAWIEEQGWKKQIIAKRAKPYLADEVAKKVVDTLMGLVTSIRHNDDTLLPFHAALNTQKLDVVLFLTLNYTPKDYNRLAIRLSDVIRKRLHFLRLNQVTVCNEQSIPPNAGWSVTRNAA